MAQIFVSAMNDADLKHCNESCVGRKLITITAQTPGGELKVYTGIVKTIEDLGPEAEGGRWRITIEEVGS